jgi:hypothetical protein
MFRVLNSTGSLATKNFMARVMHRAAIAKCNL